MFLSSHRKEIYPSTSFDENCIEFEFQTYGNFYNKLSPTFLALELKLFKGHEYDIYITMEVRKVRKEESTEATDAGETQGRRNLFSNSLLM